MKRSLLLAVLCCALPPFLIAENRGLEQGTIVRMRMTDCVGQHHAFMNAMSGAAQAPSGDQCPEYVLVTDRVVYVIVGKTSDQLVPLAETTRFHFQNNEVLIRVDDARRESRFHVKEMALRAEWDRNQKLVEAEAEATANMHRHMEGAVMLEARQ
jgi:hypothetical protein